MANFRKVTKGESKGRPATQIEVEAFTAIANLQDENRELRVKIQQLTKEVEYLQDKVRVSDIVIKDHWETIRELVSSCDVVSTFVNDITAIDIISNEEYRLLVVEPFNKALARAKGEEK